jgi:hypothetical protein
MTDIERRSGEPPRASLLRQRLNPEQQRELAVLEQFGWELAFIRQPQFQPPMAVVHDRSSGQYAVLGDDGTLNEHPALRIRP